MTKRERLTETVDRAVEKSLWEIYNKGEAAGFAKGKTYGDKVASYDAQYTFRGEIRAIMRGEDVDNVLAHNLIREVTEWHDEQRRIKHDD